MSSTSTSNWNAEAKIPTQKELAKRYKVKLTSRPWLLIQALILAHVGTLIIVAIYYGLFETTNFMTTWWHHTVPDGDIRHNIRDVAEGVLGALLAKGVLWNHFTKSHQKSGRVYDWMHDKARIPMVPSALLATLVLTGAAFVLGTWFFHHAVPLHAASVQPTGSVWHRTSTLWNSNWDKKVLAFICTFLGSRPMHDIYDDAQGYFAGRRVSGVRKHHWWQRITDKLYPITFKNRVAYLMDHPSRVKPYSQHVDNIMRLIVLICVGLAAWGYYILTFIA